MTTQDIYAWVQMGLQIVIGGGIGIGIFRYFGILRRAIEGQEKTIAAQAEQMKAQNIVLQDSERLNKMMQQVIDFVNPEAQLKREQAFQVRVQRDADDRFKELSKLLEEHQKRFVQDASQAVMQGAASVVKLLYNLLPLVYPPLRQELIEASDLIPESKANLQRMAQTMDYTPVTDEASLEALWDRWRNSPLLVDPDLARLARARAKATRPLPLPDAVPSAEIGSQA
jgi:hypothetical protein